MSDKSTDPTHEHEGFFDRILHHHKKEEDKRKQNEHEHEQEAKDPNPAQKKESEMDKFKDYIHEDEEIEREGGTYGNLM